MKNNFWLRLFALPFMAVGIWMLYSIGSNLADGARMSSWETVRGYVISGGSLVWSVGKLDTFYQSGGLYR